MHVFLFAEEVLHVFFCYFKLIPNKSHDLEGTGHLALNVQCVCSREEHGVSQCGSGLSQAKHTAASTEPALKVQEK